MMIIINIIVIIINIIVIIIIVINIFSFISQPETNKRANTSWLVQETEVIFNT